MFNKFFYVIDFNVTIGSKRDISFHIEARNIKELKALLKHCIEESEKIV